MRYTILVAAAILAGQLNAQESLKQTAYLKASNPHAGDHFGCGGVLDGHTGNSVAVSADGNTMAVGAPHADTVYVFSRNGTAWAQQANVKASQANVEVNRVQRDDALALVKRYQDLKTVIPSRDIEAAQATGQPLGERADHVSGHRAP